MVNRNSCFYNDKCYCNEIVFRIEIHTMTKTRFAPSPTGYLHVGNVRTALVNYLFAKKTGGEFVLRVDDTDLERSKPEYVDALQQDLKWLRINWDSSFKQSERFDKYEAAKQKLISDGRLYPCFETQDELETKRKFQMKRGVPPIYDRAALKLSDSDREQLESEGKKPHYRFKLNHEEISWNDLVRGETKFHGENLSDPILFRGDGTLTYMLCSVVDDGEFDITHIVRGEDHVSNTAIQIQLAQALGYKIPECAHISLLKTKDGEMSKRKGGSDIRGLRADGVEPQAILSLLAKMGTSDAIDLKTFDELVEEFDFAKFGRSTAIFQPEDLERLTHKVVSHLEYAEVKDRVEVDEDFWNAVRANLNKVSDVNEWYEICKKELTPQIDDIEFTKSAIEHLPENLDFSEWMNAVKEASGRKGKELFMPIRKALTAKEHGPELKAILPLIGRDKIVARLQGEAA